MTTYANLDICDLRTAYYQCLNIISLVASEKHPNKQKADEGRAQMADAYNNYPVMFVDTSIEIFWKYREYFDTGDMDGLFRLNFDSDAEFLKRTARERFDIKIENDDNPADVLKTFQGIWKNMSPRECEFIKKKFTNIAEIMRRILAAPPQE